jgi:site-specific DNA recombinase
MTRIGYSYARVSSLQQEDGPSLEDQERNNFAYAEKHQIRIIKPVREVWSRFELWDRPGITQIREDIKQGKITDLVVDVVDRLSGDLAHVAIIFEECERHGVTIHTSVEPFEYTAEGKLIFSVKAYAAELERLKMYERLVLRGKRGRLLRGQLLRAGGELYGYRKNREKGIREIFEPEANIVREIFDKSLEGWGSVAIARDLNAREIPAPSSGKRIFRDGHRGLWQKSSIAKILKEPAYCGLSYGWRWQSKKEKGKKRRVTERPREEWIELPGETTPAIVPAETWEAVQEAIAGRKHSPKVKTRHQALLRGHLFCSKCGRLRSPDFSAYGYRCTSKNAGTGFCGAPSVPLRTVERSVWGQIERALENPELIIEEIKRALANQPQDVQIEREADEARAAIQKIERQQEQLVEQLLEAEPEWKLVFEKKRKSLASQKRELETRLKSLERSMVSQVKLSTRLHELEEFCRDAAPISKDFSFEDKRKLLAALGVRIRAAGKTIESIEFSLRS